jgi:hypothetical protein
MCRLEKFFDGFKVRYVPRLDYCDVDHLAWITSSRAPTPPDVNVEKLSKPSVKPAEAVSEAINQDPMVIDEPEQEPTYDWMSPTKCSWKISHHQMTVPKWNISHASPISSI